MSVELIRFRHAGSAVLLTTVVLLDLGPEVQGWEPPGRKHPGDFIAGHLLTAGLVVGPVHNAVRGAGLSGRREDRTSRHGNLPSRSTTRADLLVLGGSWGGLPRTQRTLAHGLLLLRQRDGADFSVDLRPRPAC